jgi:photosystem II stability/assembly factor-like uncharacterized protein
MNNLCVHRALRQMRLPHRLGPVLLSLFAASALPVGATPVGDAVERQALMVRQPARVVTLSAAMAGDRVVAVGERGVIALSDDRGARWRQAVSPVSVTLTQVRFADARHGVAIGHGGTVLTTDDAGATWQRRLDGRRLALLAQEAAKASGDPAQQRDADRLVADGPDKPFLDVAIWDAKRLLVVGAYGIAFHSSDGGQTWRTWMDRLPNPKALHLYVLRRQGSTLLLAGEQGLLLRSDDDGANFRPLTSPYRGSWFAGEMLPSGEWVLGGLRGNAWRSADGGASWTALAVPMPAAITGMAVDPSGELLFVNQAGHVLKRDGDRLVPTTRDAMPPLAGLSVLPGGGLLTYGVAGVALVGGTPAAAR